MEISLILFGAVVLAVAVYLWQTKHIRDVMKEGNEEDKKKEAAEEDVSAVQSTYNPDMDEDKRVDIKVGFWQAVKIGFGVAFGAFLFSLIIFALAAVLWGTVITGFLHPFSLF